MFSVREYPCDHYMSIINVTLLNAGCPRADIQEMALQLLHILDHRFFRSKSALAMDDPAATLRHSGSSAPPTFLDGPIIAGYPCSQVGASRKKFLFSMQALCVSADLVFP